MALLGLSAWAGGLLACLTGPVPTMLVVGAAGLAGGLRRWARAPVPVLFGCLLAGTAVAGSALLRTEATTEDTVAQLAAQRAFVTATVRVSSDPRLRPGEHRPFVLLRAQVVEMTGRGHTFRTGVPVLVLADPRWEKVPLGARVRLSGRLGPARSGDLAAVIWVDRPPVVLAQPGPLFDGAAAVRSGIRSAVATSETDARSLVPALVVGDDHAMSEELLADFRASGLTHLAAVSGTNLTLVVGFVLIVARWAGVRARGLVVVGALGVAGFVLLARTEPSVVRAAAMGSVALIGMGTNGREKGVRALGAAVLLLLLYQPWLAVSVGFALSVLATAGILFLAPPWRDALRRWLPRWAAEAVSVPLAAQLVCTPVVAAISGQVSLVAVVANMLVAPAVGPATVLGLTAGLVLLVAAPAGLFLGRLAGWCAGWIVAVAEHSGGLPTAAVDWSARTVPIAVLTVLCLAVALHLHRLLERRWWSLALTALVAVGVLRPATDVGWPPSGWVMVACDVGQGDGLVLNAGRGRAVVVDTGAEEEPIRRCLDRLEVERVPAVVLTHFHADHVGGLVGVLEGTPVGEVQVTGLEDPEAGAAAVRAAAAASEVPVRVPDFGEVVTVGAVTWQVLGPRTLILGEGTGEEGSAPNNASLVLLATVRGVRLLLTGDIEPEAQAALAGSVPELQVDVLKVPHHGSRFQDPRFLSSLGARVAVISAGADNDYGHPAPDTLRLLEDSGMLVRRTDVSGDVAVLVPHGGGLAVVGRDE